MKVTFEFPDNLILCAMYLNYVLWDSNGELKMGAKGVNTEDLRALKMDKNKVLPVGDDKLWDAPEDATAADVTPIKHGVWEKTGDAYLLRCSACHDCYIDEDWLDGKKWNFCPECGAKMNGGDDDAAD